MDPVIAQTREWISSVVIGLNLCPFARKVFDAEKIHYVVSAQTTAVGLAQDFREELHRLQGASIEVIETTLLIHPHVLQNFFDFNDFLHTADTIIDETGLRGVIQVASFHPRYQFAGTDPNDPENETNRSPYPMLHLLREESITRLGIPEEELLKIPERNIETMRKIHSRKP